MGLWSLRRILNHWPKPGKPLRRTRRINNTRSVGVSAQSGLILEDAQSLKWIWPRNLFFPNDVNATTAAYVAPAIIFVATERICISPATHLRSGARLGIVLVIRPAHAVLVVPVVALLAGVSVVLCPLIFVADAHFAHAGALDNALASCVRCRRIVLIVHEGAGAKRACDRQSQQNPCDPHRCADSVEPSTSEVGRHFELPRSQTRPPVRPAGLSPADAHGSGLRCQAPAWSCR